MIGMNKENVTDDKRIEEITTVMNLINNICCIYGITLIAKERKGKNIVVIQDTLNNDKEYIMIKNKWGVKLWK